MPVLHRTTLEYRQRAHYPDFKEGGVHYDNGNWIIEPDMSGVDGVPRHFWKLDGDRPVEMSAAEKQVVDDARAAQQLSRAKEARIQRLHSRLLRQGSFANAKSKLDAIEAASSQAELDAVTIS